MKKFSKLKIGVIGLGYVGLPLLNLLNKKFDTKGFDLNVSKINELKKGFDRTNELKKKDISALNKNIYSSIKYLKDRNFFIVAVPTPININKSPDLRFIKSACEIISKIIKKNDTIVFESTGYPGLVEDFCVPIIEKNSNLKYPKDFQVGYSPERVNPGDKKRGIENIKKIISASDKEALRKLKFVYGSIVNAGIYVSNSIKVAEAAKVIENTQRDINIALINELSKIFNKLKIDTKDVLDAASTKWNFHKYMPGLVGGHCIGVDPYYLTYKAKKININPNIILAGRKINDEMSKYVFKRILFILNKNKIKKKILILGCTFKENCPDIRNSKVFDLINFLKKNKLQVDLFDPIASKNDVKKEYKVNLLNKVSKKYGLIILAVSHKYFKLKVKNPKKKYGLKNSIFFDLKSFYSKKISDYRL